MSGILGILFGIVIILVFAVLYLAYELDKLRSEVYALNNRSR